MPDVHDPDFDEKVAEIEADTRYFDPSSRGREARLEDLWEGIKSVRSGVADGELSLEHGRSTILRMLAEIGVKAKQFEYDNESAGYNVDLKVSMGEFPILYPYPRTGTRAYATHKGWFDGDFDRLHHSYQNRSPSPALMTERKPYSKI